MFLKREKSSSCNRNRARIPRMSTSVKGKAVLLQAWSVPKCSRNLRFPDFMTVAQDGGKVVSLKNWPPLPPGYTPGTHFC
jgi:hypothetical protein